MLKLSSVAVERRDTADNRDRDRSSSIRDKEWLGTITSAEAFAVIIRKITSST
jgi:hypothetical protein